MSSERRDTLAPSPRDIAARLEAERAGRPFLVLRDHEHAQQIVTLPDDGRLSVGRDEANGLCLHWDPGVSRLHAELEWIGGEWTVSDDGLSRNGTFLSGERVQGRRRLSDGDQLLFGNTPVTFRLPFDRERSSTLIAASIVPPKLTDAQRRVLIALCRPYAEGSSFATPATNRQIAEELFLSVDAVKTHLRSLGERFELADLPQNVKRTRLVERAFELGVVTQRDLGAPGV